MFTITKAYKPFICLIPYSGEIAENQNENQPVATDEKTENDQCDDYLNPNDSQIVSIEKGEQGVDLIGLQHGNQKSFYFPI